MQDHAGGLRSSPLEDSSLAVRGFGDDSNQPIRFYLYQDVLEELAFAASYDDRPVCAAILLGGFGVEQGRGFVEITGFAGTVWAARVEDVLPEIRATADDAIQSAGGDAIAGLFVAESGGNAHVTEEVARLHFSLFNVPFQAALVCDPVARAVTLSARAPGGRMFNAAFRAVAVKRQAALNGNDSSGMTSIAQLVEEE